MTLAYYPGCSMHGTSREYEESLLAVAAALESDLTEIDDWSCCGASSAHLADHLLGVALPARNLALAEAQGADEVLAPCAACYNRLSGAVHAVAEEPGMAAKVPEVLGRPFANTVRVLSIVELLQGLAPLIEERVAARLEPNPLEHLNIAAYWGCLLVRPAAITGFDDAEQPTGMDDVIARLRRQPGKLEHGRRVLRRRLLGVAHELGAAPEPGDHRRRPPLRRRRHPRRLPAVPRQPRLPAERHEPARRAAHAGALHHPARRPRPGPAHVDRWASSAISSTPSRCSRTSPARPTRRPAAAAEREAAKAARAAAKAGAS